MKWTKENIRAVLIAAGVALVVLCALWVVTHQEVRKAAEAEEPQQPALSAEEAYQFAAAYHASLYPELNLYEYQERRTLPEGNGYAVSFRRAGFLFTYYVTGPLGTVTAGETDYQGVIPSDGWHLPDPPGKAEEEPEPEPGERPLPEGVPAGEEENWALVRVALAHAEVDERTVSAWDVSYEYDGDKPMCYKVRFRTGGTDYGYELGLDGTTILAWERNTPYTEENPPEPAEEPEHASSIGEIGEVRAKAAALEAAGVDMAAVRWLRAKRTEDGEGPRYEVSFELGGRTYRYTVDAATGEVLH